MDTFPRKSAATTCLPSGPSDPKRLLLSVVISFTFAYLEVVAGKLESASTSNSNDRTGNRREPAKKRRRGVPENAKHSITTAPPLVESLKLRQVMSRPKLRGAARLYQPMAQHTFVWSSVHLVALAGT